jgi:hypothetical protein
MNCGNILLDYISEINNLPKFFKSLKIYSKIMINLSRKVKLSTSHPVCSGPPKT